MERPPVYVVEDDREVRASLAVLLRSMEMTVRPFLGGHDFLDDMDFLEPGVVLLDLRMPEMSGLEMLRQMRAGSCYWPAIVMSGHGDIAAAVEAVKLGALEFLQKPFSEEDLLAALQESIRSFPAALAKSRSALARKKIVSALSTRERQVLDGVIVGKSNKTIAAELGLSPRTVESYRVTMMAKTGARNLHDLLTLIPDGSDKWG
ncbi:MAG: response regulator [Sphingomonadaceae bacterium]